MLKKVLVSVLILVMLVTMIPQSVFAAPGRGVGLGNAAKVQAQNQAKNQALLQELQEQLSLMMIYGNGTWTDLPYGLAKKGEALPPGLRFILERTGSLPYGLAKRLGEATKPKEEVPSERLLLDRAIKEAEALLVGASPATHLQAQLDKLTNRLAVAKNLLVVKPAAKKEEIQPVLDDLRQAITAFKAAEIYDANLLQPIVKELNAFKNMYFVDEEVAKNDPVLIAVNILLVDISKYLRAENPMILTKALYEAIVKEASKYKAYDMLLTDLIQEISSSIYFYNAKGQVVKNQYTEGTEQGNVTVGSYKALEVVLAAAKSYLKDTETYTYVDLLKHWNVLNQAFESFKNSIILGADDLSIIKNLLELLVIQQENDDSETLKLAIKSFEDVIDQKYVTKGQYSILIDLAAGFVKELLDTTVDTLQKKIVESKKFLDKEEFQAYKNVSAFTLLQKSVENAEAYLQESVKTYSELMVYHDAIKEAHDIFVELNEKIIEILVLVEEAEKLEDGGQPEGLNELLESIIDLLKKNDDGLYVNDITFASVNDLFIQLDLLLNPDESEED